MPATDTGYKNQCIISSLLVVLLLILFPAQALSAAKAETTPLSVAYCLDCTPFQFTNSKGEPDGLILDYWKLWSRKTGTPITYKPARWNESIALVRDGKVDAHAGLGFSSQRNNFLEYGQRLSTTPANVFFHNSISIPEQQKDILAYRIGVLAGDMVQDFIKSNFPQASIVAYPNYDQMMAALKSKEIRVFAADTPTGLYHLSKAKLSKEFHHNANTPLYESPWYVASTKGNTATITQINKGMSQISLAEENFISRSWASAEGNLPSDTLIIPIMYDYPPLMMTGLDGEPTGFLIDFWNLWSKTTGTSVHFKEASWGETLSMLKRGSADIHPGLFQSQSRSRWMLFSDPIQSIFTALYFKRGNDQPVPLDLMSGRTVGVMKGSYQEQFIQNKYPHVKTTGYKNNEDMVVALLKGEIDALANEVPTVESDLNKFNLKGSIVRYNENIFEKTLHAGVLKSSPDLLKKINTGIQSIPQPQLAELERRWFPGSDNNFYTQSAFEEQTKLTEREKQWIEDHPIITVGVTSFIKPIDVLEKTGKYTGFNADLINKLNSYLRINLTPVFNDSWSKVVENSISGKVNCTLSMSKTPEREEALLFSAPYAIDPVVVIVGANTNTINKWDDLSGKKLSVVKGASMICEIMDQDNTQNILFVENETEGINLLTQGKVDAHVSWMIPYTNAMQKLNHPNVKIAVRRASESGTFRIATHNSLPELKSILDKGIKRIPPNELEELKSKWLYPSQDTTADPVLLSKEERQWIESRRAPILVGAEVDWPPFDFLKKGNPTGYSNELLKLAAKKAGLPLEFVSGHTWAELLTLLDTGKIDLLPAVYKTENRIKTMVMTQPYISNPLIMVTHDSFKGTPSLSTKGLNLAVVEGFSVNDTLRQKYPHIKKLIVKNALAGLKAVSLKKTDVFIGSLGVITYLLKENMIPNIRIVDEVWLDNPDATKLHVAASKDKKTLISIIQKGLDAIPEKDKNHLRAEWLNFNVIQGRRASIQLSEAERQWISQAPPIRYSVDPSWPPIERLNHKTKQYEGIAADYLALITDITGIQFELVPTKQWSESVKLAKSGKTDMLVAASKTKEREQFLNFSKPYITLSNAVVMRNDSPFINDISDLEGLRIGVGDGNSIHRYLQKNYPKLTLIPNKGSLNGLKRVSDGELDAYVGTLEVLGYLINKNGMFNLKATVKLPISRDLHIGLSKELAPEALSIINKVLHSITPEENSSIFRKWISLRVEEKFDYTLVYRYGIPIGGVAIIIIGIIVFWNRKLAAEITERSKVEAKLSDAFGVITSSIQYASRIQQSVLPTSSQLESTFKEHFVLWEPRDVVGGDIYWTRVWGDGKLVLLADCTGHGVPGAFMTLITSGALDRAIHTTPIGDTAQLIQKMHQFIQDVLSQDNNQSTKNHSSDDGLELGACYIPANKKQVVFSGAGFPLFVWHNKAVKLIKGDRKGIGYRGIPADQTWTNKEITVENDMIFYMSSDGIFDQIGGPKKRGFGKKRFVKMLETIQNNPLKDQGTIILERMVGYQGDEIRRDDISAIGFRL
ncbi:MAG: transporter substrate-binding domain-containing protein [Desulfovibrio sp.]